MLTIEIKVNGQLVAAISAARVSTRNKEGYEYAAQVIEFKQFDVDTKVDDMVPLVCALRVRHFHKEGILKLASILCQEAWDSFRGSE